MNDELKDNELEFAQVREDIEARQGNLMARRTEWRQKR